ncbi:DUF1993 domain-containing protein [Henriciella mobilis]|uniref:DUF1993 domain-containing protein n=1 Tax=Henriciella mobilis TaxID=2305467 RepID=A0A399R9U9_9PROT|nr:DUF1993 domain-containing protein [Henriciella mobilis]RIJ14739.1 DUF1993 domain-containing protein [Henriciella mobilis]RIJ21696.1 DUF1993 domain-containing protein [Henriciella mobilis]RIJ26805.1 DUF1993 domain-containing protein [Henriciella mobilis]
MSLSLYDIVVPPFRQVVGSVQGILKKGADHYRADGRSPDDLLRLRIHEDMLPLTFQLHSVAHHSIGAINGVKTGTFAPPSGLAELDFAGFEATLEKASQDLASVDADALNACQGKDVIFKIGPREMPFTAEGFLLSFSKPNAYFHATTAYNILRMQGVPLGKRDYMGQMQLKA